MPAGEYGKRRGEQNTARFLKALREGKTDAEALEITGVSPNWLRKRREDREFRASYKRAKAAQAVAAAEGFPDFLSFREEHFAYEVPWLKHKETGLATVRRATNSWFQMDASEKLEELKRSIVVMPPGHIKTTFFSMEYPTYRIMKDRNFRGLIVMKNQDEAAKIVNAVQERLQHPYYHDMIERMTLQGDEPITCPVCRYGGTEGYRPAGKGMGDKWGAYGFRVIGRTSGEKDDSFQAKGVGSQIQGVRSDLIVLDDVQDPIVATKSPQDSKDKVDWFKKVILGRVYDWQTVCVLGNFFSPDDFMHQLIDDDGSVDFDVTQYPAIVDEERQKVLCPEVWTYKALMQKKKEVGPEVWHFTWMQDDRSLESATFRREALEDARDPELRLGVVPYDVTDIFLGVDPATSSSGYCAMVCWGIDRNSKQRYLIDVFNQQGMRTWDNVIEQVLEMCRNYQPDKVIYEGNNTQKAALNMEAMQRGLRNLGVKQEVYQTMTGTGARALQSNFDITTIGGLYDAGLITLPYGGTMEDRKRVDDYITQFLAWRTDPNGHSLKWLTRDMVMATLFAESEAFLIAGRERKKIPASTRARVPKWARNSQGGFAFRR